jgi:hypothetical protein
MEILLLKELASGRAQLEAVTENELAQHYQAGLHLKGSLQTWIPSYELKALTFFCHRGA